MLWAVSHITAIAGDQMAQATQQRDAIEALLRQTIYNDLAFSPDPGRIWAGLYERIAGPRAGDMRASRGTPRCASGCAEAEEVGLSRTT
jgi:hypothetical protein